MAAKLKQLNPGFDGKVTHKIEGGVVTELEFLTGQRDGHFAGAGLDRDYELIVSGSGMYHRKDSSLTCRR